MATARKKLERKEKKVGMIITMMVLIIMILLYWRYSWYSWWAWKKFGRWWMGGKAGMTGKELMGFKIVSIQQEILVFLCRRYLP